MASSSGAKIHSKNMDYFKFKKIVIDGNRDDYKSCSRDIRGLCDAVQTLSFRYMEANCGKGYNSAAKTVLPSHDLKLAFLYLRRSNHISDSGRFRGEVGSAPAPSPLGDGLMPSLTVR